MGSTWLSDRRIIETSPISPTDTGGTQVPGDHSNSQHSLLERVELERKENSKYAVEILH